MESDLQSLDDFDLIKELSAEVSETPFDTEHAPSAACLEYIPLPAFMKDRQYRYRVANKRFCDFLGVRLEDILNKTPEEIAPPDMAARYRQADRELFLKGGEQRYDAPVFSETGERHWVQFQKIRLERPDGTPFGILGLVFDITQQKVAELELKAAQEETRQALEGVLAVSNRLLGKRDPYTASHQDRVTAFCRLLGQELGLSEDRLKGLVLGAQVHDLGKVAIPAQIINKPGRPSDAEMALIREHPIHGYEILSDIEFPWPVAEIVYQHHERLDGSGYPRGLAGDEILLEAQIIAVTDVIEAMTSHRPYRPGRPWSMVVEELQAGRGTRYDAVIVDTAIRLVESGAIDLTGWQG
ncbi:MAG: HD domain-containing phosphohydrolase [Magnetovibrionaceae bacterium]